jgi:integrase
VNRSAGLPTTRPEGSCRAPFRKPFFRKPRQTWYVQIDGKQINLGRDKDAAFARYHDLMRQEKPREVDCSLVVGVLDAFLNWVQNNKKPRTFEWYQRHLQVFAKSIPPLLAVGQLKKHHLTACVEGLGEWSSTTKNGLCRAAVRALQWAEDEEHIARSPLGRFKKPRTKRREVVIPQEEFDAMVGHFPSLPIKDLLTFAWEVGPRPQELVAIEARHVDVAAERVVFPAEESKGQRFPRVLYLTGRALEIASRLAATYPSGVLFRNTDGRPWTRQSLACLFGRMQVAQGLKAMKAGGIGPPPLPRFKRHAHADKVQLIAARAEQQARIYERRKELSKLARQHGKKYSLYHFRHAWATRTIQRGVDPLTVAILLGHSDPSTLAKVYAHLAHDPDYLRKSIRKATGGGDAA